MNGLQGLTIFDYLCGANVPLRASAGLGAGISAALWDRDEVAIAHYDTPSHHTLSLYVSGGEKFRRRVGQALVPSLGPGSLCLMPRGASSAWETNGPVRMFHLYISRQALDRSVAETIGADPAALGLQERLYFNDPVIEGMIRAAILPLKWDEPAERIAVSHASQSLIAYLAARMTNRGPRTIQAQGGLAPWTLKRLEDFIDAHLAEPLTIADLVSCAGLSPYHFARAFKRSTGESPHAFVLRHRVEHAKTLFRDGLPLADLAAACGFSSQSHFTARFREATGVTPGQYEMVTARRMRR
jgi:AraC family transcriptional regulator